VFSRERQAASAYWTANQPPLTVLAGGGYPFDYSFTQAVRSPAGPGGDEPASDLFVVILDASSASVTSDQRAWLAAQLSSAEAVAAAARIVVGHLPLVPVSQGRDSPGEYVFQGVELGEVLADGEVDLYVSGHHAAYYAGRLNGLELLFAGGIGGRRLVGSSREPRSTVTVVDIWLGDSTSEPTFVYTTFDLATMSVVDPGKLPEVIGAVVISDRVGGYELALGQER
jgi:hypothetical protein